jgi:hypothetical protein
MPVTRAFVDDVGPVAEDYFLYMEDLIGVGGAENTKSASRRERSSGILAVLPLALPPTA